MTLEAILIVAGYAFFLLITVRFCTALVYAVTGSQPVSIWLPLITGSLLVFHWTNATTLGAIWLLLAVFVLVNRLQAWVDRRLN